MILLKNHFTYIKSIFKFFNLFFVIDSQILFSSFVIPITFFIFYKNDFHNKKYYLTQLMKICPYFQLFV